ncbi:MAG: hypothetical protein JW873_01755 [Candidatus Saganbacteria bacterium]|nr:hypothetical protein [Candidatus Saganbacteria bacterium]
MGRFFSVEHRRMLGVHIGIPFGNSLNKANDPYINSYSLTRLLKDPATRPAALANAMRRADKSPALCRAILAAADGISETLVGYLAEHIKKEDVGLSDRAEYPYILLLADLPRETVAKIHQLWTRIKPATYEPFPVPSALDGVTVSEVKTTDRLTLLCKDYTEWLQGWDIKSVTELEAFKIDGLLFVC